MPPRCRRAYPGATSWPAAAFSSTSCEVCQKNMYGLMVVPMTPVMT